MAMSYRVTQNGVTATHEASEDMEAIFKSLREWGGWCRCGHPVAGTITHRGHSVDVDCANCGGAIQIG